MRRFNNQETIATKFTFASAQVFAWVGDLAGEGAGGDGGGRCQENMGFLMAHATREIPVGGADALERCVDAAERVHGPAEAGGAAGVFSHLHAGGDEDLPNGLLAPTGGLQIVNDLGRSGHAKGVDGDAFAAEHASEFEE